MPDSSCVNIHAAFPFLSLDVEHGMALQFVIATPGNRTVNRNNNKLIQQKATQAGAKTRASKKSGTNPIAPNDTERRHDKETLANPPKWHPKANGNLALKINSPFLAEFGNLGRMLVLPHPVQQEPSSGRCFNDTSMSVMQQMLLTNLDSTMTQDANRVFKIMTLTHRQFLAHLPSHYGFVDYLDKAIDCVVAKLHEAVPLIEGGTETLTAAVKRQTIAYSSALRSLRHAIDNPRDQELTYVWFAITLLTVFELLSTESKIGWVWHAAGAARTLHRLGPENITSEFHFSLLSLQCRIQTLETIFNNKHCYLAESNWQDAIRRTIKDDERFGDRSEVSTNLWLVAARVPNIFHAVTAYVHSPGKCDGSSLVKTLRGISNDLKAWSGTWSVLLEYVCRDPQKDLYIRHQTLMMLLAWHTMMTFADRLRIAVAPYQQLDLEDQVQRDCEKIAKLRSDLMSRAWWRQSRGFVFDHATSATLDSALKWREAIETARPATPVCSKMFEEWCSAMGRERSSAPHCLI